MASHTNVCMYVCTRRSIMVESYANVCVYACRRRSITVVRRQCGGIVRLLRPTWHVVDTRCRWQALTNSSLSTPSNNFLMTVCSHPILSLTSTYYTSIVSWCLTRRLVAVTAVWLSYDSVIYQAWFPSDAKAPVSHCWRQPLITCE